MKKEKSLETLLVLTGAFIVLYWIYLKKIFLLLGLLLVLIGIVSPYLSEKIAKSWLKLAELIGAVMSKVILSVVFFTFLTPIALLSKLFRKDSLSLKKKDEASYYVNRDYLYSSKDLENTW